MSQQTLSLGTAANDGTGDSLRVAGGKINANFTEVYASLSASQPLDADLTAIAALTSAADKLPYATGAGAWALATFTAAGRALVDDADAAAQRLTLGFGSQAAHADAATVLITGGSIALTGNFSVGNNFAVIPASGAVVSGGYCIFGNGTLGAGVSGSFGVSGKASLATLNIFAVPTSASGLITGDVWSNSGVLTIVT